MSRFKLSTWRLTSLLVVFVISQARTALGITFKSGLCEPKDMSCEKENGDGCSMKYYKLNSTDCKNMRFRDVLVNGESDLGLIRIKSYHYSLSSYKQTGFNLTFSKIKWNHLKFRFQQEGNEMKNTCREFYLTTNSSVEDLFYDCIWSTEDYEGKTFSFEYEASDDTNVIYKKTSFKVPFAKNIEDTTPLEEWEIFMHVEVFKNPFGLTTFILRWQPLPERFSINTYNLSIYSNESGHPEVTYSTNVTCSSEDDCKYYYNKWYGNIQFGIQALCKEGSQCLVSKTVVFLLGGENAKPLLIGIVSVTLIIPVMMYVLYLLRNYMIKRSKKWVSSVPKLLVVFTPSLSYHVNAVFALVEYLKMYCNVEPLVDELHIFHSKSRDPFKWCNEAFKSADSVMVIASPYHKHLRLADSVYQNTDVLLLRLLRESLATRENRTRFFVLLLPYCSEKDVPAEAANLKRFSFPEDLNKMLRFVHRDSSAVADCVALQMPGGKDDYKMLGTKLKSAITEAQADLKANKAEYEKTIEELKSEKGNCDDALLSRRTETREVESRFKDKTRTEDDSAARAFSEYPGRLDDMNLSGEETESLMGFGKPFAGNGAFDVGALDL